MRLFGKKRTYLDYASAAPVRPEAVRAMHEASRLIGNPGAIHAEGVEAARALSGARGLLAGVLGVKSRELIFTSGLTESNNLAILGVARMLERKKRTLAGTHWLVSAIEHPAVLDCFAEIERLGGAVSFIEPEASGLIAAGKVRALLRKESVFVSVGWANNEIGVVQPLSRIRNELMAHEKEHHTTVLLHSDAGQAPLYLPSTVHALGVDLLSLGGNKLYGPHGVGAVYLGNRAELASVLQGGPQERGLRPGTENVALAAGFAAAFGAVAAGRESEAKRLRALRDGLARTLKEKIPGLVVNGDLRHCLPHMLNVSVPDIQSEYVTLALDCAGIAVSTKSACREGEEQESHVVAALGGEAWRAENTLRVSLGDGTKKKDLQRFVDTLRVAVSDS